MVIDQCWRLLNASWRRWKWLNREEGDKLALRSQPPIWSKPRDERTLFNSANEHFHLPSGSFACMQLARGSIFSVRKATLELSSTSTSAKHRLTTGSSIWTFSQVSLPNKLNKALQNLKFGILAWWFADWREFLTISIKLVKHTEIKLQYKRKQKTSEEFDRNSSTCRFEGWNKDVGSENFEDEEFTWICHSANQAKKEASEEEAPEAPWVDVHTVWTRNSHKQTVRFSSVRLLIARRIWANFEW